MVTKRIHHRKLIPPMPSAVQAELMAAVDTSSSVCIYETGVQSGVVEALLQRGSNSFRPFWPMLWRFIAVVCCRIKKLIQSNPSPCLGSQGGGAHSSQRRERVCPGVPGGPVQSGGDGGQDLRQHPAGGGHRPRLLPAVQPDLQLPNHHNQDTLRHRSQRWVLQLVKGLCRKLK